MFDPLRRASISGRLSFNAANGVINHIVHIIFLDCFITVIFYLPEFRIIIIG